MTKISNEQYKYLETLGAGSYGEALLVLDTKQNKKFVAKKVSLAGCKPMEVVEKMKEVFILMDLDHSNILKYYEKFEDKHNELLYIVTEYCESGTLANRLNQELHEDTIKNWLVQITNALIYIHSKSIIHRDIKPENIFIKGDQLKLGDFGLAKVFESSQTSTFRGTVLYAAPEILDGNAFTPQADVWSLGIVFHQICTKGKLPFKTIKAIFFEKLQKLDTEHQKFENLVIRMLDRDVESRITTKDLLTELTRDEKSSVCNETVNSSVRTIPSGQKNIECKATLEGHSDSITCLLLLSSEELASGSNDFTVRLWSIQDYQCLRILNGHTDRIQGLLELKSGELISHSSDNTLRIWNVKDGKCEGVLEHGTSVYCALGFSNGELVSGEYVNTVKVWNVKDKKCVANFRAGGTVNSLLELKNGKLAVGMFGNVIIYNLETKVKVATIGAHEGKAIDIMIQLKSGELITASNIHNDTCIKMWNIDKRECLATLECKKKVYCVVEITNGEFISGHKDEIKIWNVQKAECVASLDADYNMYNFLKLHNDEIVSFGGMIQIWDIKQRKCLANIKGHGSLIKCMIELKNGDHVSGSVDNTIKIWSISD